jgi:hypothetical protein
LGLASARHEAEKTKRKREKGKGREGKGREGRGKGRGRKEEGAEDPMTLATDLRLWEKRKGGMGGEGHSYFFFYNSITDFRPHADLKPLDQ